MIYREYSRSMFALCMRYTRCRDDAQDVLQESFIKVYQQREKFIQNDFLYAWIKKITIHTALTYIKQTYRMQLEDNELKFDKLIEEQYLNEDEIEKQQLKDKLLKILQLLPDGYRTVFNLYTVDNLTHKEIAEYLEISENTSKTQYFKAKKMIQLLLEKEKMAI